MEPLVSRQGVLGLDVEARNVPKGYLVQVLFINVSGPSPDTAGQTHCIVTMQDGVMKYALAHPIHNMLIPNMEVCAIAVHVWEKWIKHLGFPRSIHSEMGPDFKMAL